MGRMIETDVCVIGAGSGGLSVAAGAARLGARVVLIERGAMGGDCLNAGCVPSKSLLASARVAQNIRAAAQAEGWLGIRAEGPVTDFAAVTEHVRGVIAGIAPHDSQERFEGLGVTVLRATAHFVDQRTVVAGEERVRARWFVLATGSRPDVPDIPGLAEAGFLTNETVFALAEPPRRLVILGGGPIAAELGQAFCRLGVAVVVLARGRLLPREDADLAAVVGRRLRAEGVEVREMVTAVRVARQDGESVAVTLSDGTVVEGSHLLVAAGRAPVVENLGLDVAGVAVDATGVVVGKGLRTTNRRIFAVGDVAGGVVAEQGRFTHVAAHHASHVIRAMLFRLPANACKAAVPRVTYTDPELAQVGLSESQARARLGDRVRVLRVAVPDLDRARCEGVGDGLVKVVVGPRGRVLGAGLALPHAGELLAPWVMAVEGHVGLRALATAIAPYPSLAEVTKRVAGAYYEGSLFSDRTRRLVRFLMRFAPSLRR